MNKYDVGVISNGIKFTLRFVEISDAVVKLKCRDTHIYPTAISKAAPPPPPTFLFRKECRLKNYGIRLAETL
jgi:hypothetical protein